MAGKRFIFFYQLQSFLNPIPRVSITFLILYLNPLLLWMQQAQAKQSADSLPETNPKSDWELIDVQIGKASPSRLSPASRERGVGTTSDLVHEALKLYEAGQFRMAVQVWQQANLAYRAQRDLPNEAMALSNLALAYQQLGRMEQANSAIAQSLKLVKKVEKKTQNEQILAQILNNQGSLLLASGQVEQALATWEKP